MIFMVEKMVVNKMISAIMTWISFKKQITPHSHSEWTNIQFFLLTDYVLHVSLHIHILQNMLSQNKFIMYAHG